MVNANLFLAQILNLQGQYPGGVPAHDQVDVWTANEPSRREAVSNGLARVAVMLSEGNNDNAIEIAQRTYERERRDPETKASIQRFRAVFMRSLLRVRATRPRRYRPSAKACPFSCRPPAVEMKTAAARAAAREGRIRFVIESYLRLLSRDPSVTRQCSGGDVRLRGHTARTIGLASAAGVFSTFRGQNPEVGTAGAYLTGHRQKLARQ
jgi:hypothetical protein